MVDSTANQASVVEDGVQFEKQLGQLATFVRVMRQAGLPIDTALQMPIDDKEMRARLVRFWTNNGFEPSTASQKRVREIMGKDFFGVEEAIKHFGVNPTRSQFAALSEVPFSEEVLLQCKDTHVLVAVFPLSILEIREKVQGLFYQQDWYDKQSFAAEKGETCWQLVRKTEVSDSTSKNWQEQQALLGKDDETPTAQVMVYTIIGYHLNTGERLFEKLYVRTSSVYSGGHRVHVGSFDAGGLFVSLSWDGYRHYFLGVAAARKFD